MNTRIASLGVAALLSCFPASGQTSQTGNPLSAGDERMAGLWALKIDAATITQVERDPSGTRTIVKLVLNPAKGSNINVEVWLPDAEKWNARFLGLGNGGSAGKINPGSLSGPSSAGYAVATTDMGTAPNSDSGIGNPEVWKDFGFRATHLMTLAGKRVVRAYYGKGPELSYFSGGSTGGQQALQKAQRYPEDYDGIVAAIPAHCRTPLHAYFLWNDQILKQRRFTKEQETNIIAAGNETMAARETPPVAGKFVSDSRCNATPTDHIPLRAGYRQSRSGRCISGTHAAVPLSAARSGLPSGIEESIIEFTLLVLTRDRGVGRVSGRRADAVGARGCLVVCLIRRTRGRIRGTGAFCVAAGGI